MNRRQKAIAALAVGGVLFFPVSYVFAVWNSKLSIGEVLADYGFAASSRAAEFWPNLVGYEPRKSAEDFAAAIERLERRHSSEVRSAARWRLDQMGVAAIPLLLEDLSHPYRRSRTDYVLKRLGELRVQQAIPQIVDSLDTPQNFWHERILLESLREIGAPDSLPVLEYFYQNPRDWEHEERNASHRRRVAEALAASGERGARMLLAEFDTAKKWRQLEILSGLHFSRDPLVAERLTESYQHPDPDLRSAVRKCLAAHGTLALPPLARRLETSRNPFERSVLAWQIAMTASPQSVEILRAAIDDPACASTILEGWGREGGREVIDGLRDAVGIWILGGHDRALHALTEAAQRFPDLAVETLGSFLDHPNYTIRAHAISALHEIGGRRSIAHLERAQQDPEENLVRSATRAVRSVRRELHLDSLEAVLPVWAQRGMRNVVSALTSDNGWGQFALYVHCIGLLVSAFLALALIFDFARAFDAWTFRLLIQLLLLEGFAGDLLWLNRRPGELEFAFTIHLALLIGLCMLEGQRRPGAVASRFRRLGGAALWFLVPGYLYLAVPRVTEAMWIAGESTAVVPALAGVGLITAILLAERLLFGRPWLAVARWSRRVLGALISTAVFVAIARPLFELAWQKSCDGMNDEAVIIGVLLAPLLVAIVAELAQILRIPPLAPTLSSPPCDRIEIESDGHWPTIRMPSKSGWPAAIWIVCAGPFFFGAAGGLAFGRLRGDDWPAMIIATVCGVIGCLGMLAIAIDIFGRPLIQVSNGYVRGAMTVLGGCFSGGAWRRGLGTRLTLDLDPNEKRWLRRVIDSNRGEPAEHAELAASGSQQPMEARP